MSIFQSKYKLITVLGPTASGKTRLAACLADRLEGEIISADSRQVYRGMNIGTGKDYDDYFVNGKIIPYHLVDIEDPGKHYNVYRFQTDFINIYNEILSRNKFPVLCGGSGLYLESVLKDYRLIAVPPNKQLRHKLKGKSLEELSNILKNLKSELHNKTDIETERRALRAIEIAVYYQDNPSLGSQMPEMKSINIGILLDRETRRNRISDRLRQRMDQGMEKEVIRLLDSGLTPEQLIYYGLEYKYLTLYVTGKISRDDMFSSLETAIHQFAKRQMTWFRGMQKRGTVINWIDGCLSIEDKIEKIMELLNT